MSGDDIVVVIAAVIAYAAIFAAWLYAQWCGR